MLIPHASILKFVINSFINQLIHSFVRFPFLNEKKQNKEFSQPVICNRTIKKRTTNKYSPVFNCFYLFLRRKHGVFRESAHWSTWMYKSAVLQTFHSEDLVNISHPWNSAFIKNNYKRKCN